MVSSHYLVLHHKTIQVKTPGTKIVTGYGATMALAGECSVSALASHPSSSLSNF